MEILESTSENISFSPANASFSMVELLNDHHITYTLSTAGAHKRRGRLKPTIFYVQSQHHRHIHSHSRPGQYQHRYNSQMIHESWICAVNLKSDANGWIKKAMVCIRHTKRRVSRKKGTAYDRELSRGEGRGGGLQIWPKLCTHTLQLFGPTHTLRIWFLSQWQR